MATNLRANCSRACRCLDAAMARNNPTVSDGLRPDLAELIALRTHVRGWPPAQRGAAQVAGPGISPFRGRGMEYAESRPYAAGDDVRHVDWRLTARSGKLHTKMFQAEREKIALIVADTAPSLYYGTRVRFKSVQAARVGAIAAWAAQQRGDRIGALRGDTSEPPTSPQGGHRGALRVLDALVRWYAARPVRDDGLGQALAVATRLLHPGASLTVLADAGSLAAIDDGVLALLARHHELRVVVFCDPLERHPPRAQLPFAIGGAHVDLDLDAAPVRSRWHAMFSALQGAQLQRLRQMGARACIVASDDDDRTLLTALLDPRRSAA